MVLYRPWFRWRPVAPRDFRSQYVGGRDTSNAIAAASDVAPTPTGFA